MKSLSEDRDEVIKITLCLICASKLYLSSFPRSDGTLRKLVSGGSSWPACPADFERNTKLIEWKLIERPVVRDCWLKQQILETYELCGFVSVSNIRELPTYRKASVKAKLKRLTYDPNRYIWIDVIMNCSRKFGVKARQSGITYNEILLRHFSVSNWAYKCLSNSIPIT